MTAFGAVLGLRSQATFADMIGAVIVHVETSSGIKCPPDKKAQ
jgi:hypothetical protein